MATHWGAFLPAQVESPWLFLPLREKNWLASADSFD
jgi:hypothetical protein